MRYLKKILKPMEAELRSKMSHWPKIPHRYVHDSENLSPQNFTTVVTLTTWRENVAKDVYSAAKINLFRFALVKFENHETYPESREEISRNSVTCCLATVRVWSSSILFVELIFNTFLKLNRISSKKTNSKCPNFSSMESTPTVPERLWKPSSPDAVRSPMYTSLKRGMLTIFQTF